MSLARTKQVKLKNRRFLEPISSCRHIIIFLMKQLFPENERLLKLIADYWSLPMLCNLFHVCESQKFLGFM